MASRMYAPHPVDLPRAGTPMPCPEVSTHVGTYALQYALHLADRSPKGTSTPSTAAQPQAGKRTLYPGKMLWAGSHSQANIRHQRGVTLIEILVAMTILFATVTTGMVAWQNSLNSSEKAANLLQLLAKTDYCRDHVLAVLRENSAAQQSGRGEFDAVHFSWQANQLAFQPPPPRFEPESGIMIHYQPRYRLYEVILELEYKGIHRRFHYQELTWDPFAKPV